MERRTLRRKDEVLWEINPDFSSPRRRVRLPPLSGLKKKTTLAASVSMESNQIDTIVDAHIVRILKNLRTIQHQELMEMLHHRLKRFQPSTVCFKRRIESLIERDYIARCLPSNTYQYL
jgi:cullin 3